MGNRHLAPHIPRTVVSTTRRLALLAALLCAPSAARAQQPLAVPRPPCAMKSVVPPLAPDTVAENVLDSLGTVAVPARPGVRYMRNLLAARFAAAAPQVQRQAAIDRVCGLVVGGDHSDGGEDGYYLVRIHGAESVSALDAAADALRHMPGVMSAQTLALRQADAAAPAPVAAGTAACADGNSGGWLRVAALKEMIASTDPQEVQLVNGLGLGGVDTSAVQVVNDGAVCGRVAAAVAAGARFTNDGAPLLVLRAGARYVAFDPRGLNRSFFLVDTSFVFRTVLR
jgi:hypothetical protein